MLDIKDEIGNNVLSQYIDQNLYDAYEIAMVNSICFQNYNI